MSNTDNVGRAEFTLTNIVTLGAYLHTSYIIIGPVYDGDCRFEWHAKHGYSADLLDFVDNPHTLAMSLGGCPTFERAREAAEQAIWDVGTQVMPFVGVSTDNSTALDACEVALVSYADMLDKADCICCQQGHEKELEYE